jgi:hypothetical protein
VAVATGMCLSTGEDMVNSACVVCLIDVLRCDRSVVVVVWSGGCCWVGRHPILITQRECDLVTK